MDNNALSAEYVDLRNLSDKAYIKFTIFHTKNKTYIPCS